MRDIEDDKQELAVYLEALEQLVAANQKGDIALKWTGSGSEIADMENDNSGPSEEQLEWVPWNQTEVGKIPGFS